MVSIAVSGKMKANPGKLIYTEFLGSKMAAPKVGGRVRPNTSNMPFVISNILTLSQVWLTIIVIYYRIVRWS